MSNTILIPPGDAQAVLVDLIDRTALTGCTTREPSEYGDVVVSRRWAHLSSGEEVLWSLLSSLIDGDLADVFTRLDDRNLAVVVGTLGRLATPIITQAAAARANLDDGTFAAEYAEQAGR